MSCCLPARVPRRQMWRRVGKWHALRLPVLSSGCGVYGWEKGKVSFLSAILGKTSSFDDCGKSAIWEWALSGRSSRAFRRHPTWHRSFHPRSHGGDEEEVLWI